MEKVMFGFNMLIEREKRRTGDTYIGTIITFCEENSIDFEDLVKIMHGTLKDKIYVEAAKLNMLKDNDIGSSIESFFGEE